MKIVKRIVAEWEAFYARRGIKCDLSGVKIPADPGGFPRVLISAKGYPYPVKNPNKRGRK